MRGDELVLFDIGAKLGGYCSDMTRTVCIGSVPDYLREVWNVVLDAQLEAEAVVRPGMTGAEVDDDCPRRDPGGGLRRAALCTDSGHGIGLEIHEPPWITPTRGTDVLQPGMVFSIEPGVYLPGMGGVRMEDLVLLTHMGPKCCRASPRDSILSEVLVDLDR